MLCYRCGSHVPDGSEVCGACGQKFSSGNLRQATGTFSRRKLSTLGIEGAPFKPGELLCDRYLVKDAVGAGPLGYTFKAQDKEIDVEVALKAISPKLVQTQEERRAFAKEIRTARKLSHNNLIRVYEDGEAGDRPFYTMQFLDGLTLRRIIDLRKEKGQYFSLKEIEPIFAQIAAGLESAHKVLVHTDLKPENIVVLPDLLKITDLGIGNAIPRQPFVAAQRARGISYRYLAPEYCSGAELDRRADVYAMGVLLGEMVANSFPDGASSPELRAKNPDLPPVLESVYRRATNENPLSRQATVSEFWAELDAIILKVSPRAAAPRQRTARPASSELSFEIHAEDTRTPSVPTRPVSERPTQPPPALATSQPPPERRDRRSVPPPPVPGISGEDPAFTKPPPPVEGPNGGRVPAPTAEPTEVMQVPRRRAAHTPPPSRRRSGAGPLLWLMVLGIAAGVGAAYVYLVYFRGQPVAFGGDPQPVPMVASADASAAPPDRAAEEKRLEEERRAAEARRLEEERRVAEVKKVDEQRRLEDEKRAVETRRHEEEKRRKEALAKAFPGKEDPKKDPGTKPGGCPGGMKLVPAGTLRMGSAKDDPMTGFDERPLAPVEVAAFCVDSYESPNRPGGQPTVHVTFAAAEAACKARGKRLCAEEEWERACKGPGNARFPYGAEFNPETCNTSDAEGEPRAIAAIGAFPKCRSAFGVADLSGNVAEWTSSPFSAEVGDRTIKGGAADRPDYDTRCASRKNGPAGTHTDKLGFRCCADPN